MHRAKQLLRLRCAAAPALGDVLQARHLALSSPAAHGHSHGGVPCDGHSHGAPAGPVERGALDESGEEVLEVRPAPPPDPESGLPPAQRAKNLLVANYRCQLSSIEAVLPSSRQPKRSAVHGSLVPFALLPNCEPVVFLAPSDAHVANLGANPLASVTLGHTDPPQLSLALREALGIALPRVSLLGQLRPLSALDADRARERAARAHAASLGGPPPALAAAAGALEALLPYRLEAEDARWVDARGGQHPVPLPDLAGALVDPFAGGALPLLARLNGGAEAAAVHAGMCLAFLGARVEGARVFQVDRTGFSILARALAAEGVEPGWREYRFAFTQEVASLSALEETLRELAAEAADHLAEA